MKTFITHSHSTTLPAKHIGRREASVICILLFLVLMHLAGSATAQVQVEQVQRDFQVRYHMLNGNYLSWPLCSEGATPAPNFPKDNFYGDLTENPILAVQLVQDLAQKFYTDDIIYTSFVKAPNGFSDLEGAASVDLFTSADMTPFVAPSSVTTNNYMDELQTLSSQMAELTLVKVQASQIIGANDVDSKLSESSSDTTTDPSLTCTDVQDCASSEQSTLSWGYLAETLYCNSPPDWVDSLSDALGAGLHGIYNYQTITRVMECNSYTDLYDTTYTGVARNTRGKIRADLSLFPSGIAKIFLKLTKVSCGESFILPSYPGTASSCSSIFAQTRPTSAAEDSYGSWSGGSLTLGQLSTTTSYVTYSDVTPASVGSCTQDVATIYGWSVGDALAIVQPDFTTTPDPECCSSCGCSAGADSASIDSIHYSVGLGSDNFGNSAGSIKIDAYFPSLSIYTPAALRFFTAPSVQVLHSGAGALRQFVTSQIMVDVVVANATNYSMSFYTLANAGSPDGSGLYVPTGSPYTVISVSNPDASLSIFNRLRITNVTDSNTNVMDFAYNSSLNQWSLSTGGGLRQEAHTSTWDVSNTLRTETVTITNNSSQLAYKEINTYYLYPWGQEKLTNVVDPSGAALTSTWAYYTNAATDGGNYRQLKLEVNANGHWVSHQYDQYGRETNQVSQFLNSSVGSASNLNRLVVTKYTTNDPQTTIVESLLGTEIGRRYKVVHPGVVEDIQCQTQGAAWNASDNLVTTTLTYTNGSFSGKVQSVQNPNGIVQLYFYSTNSTQMTTTVLSGQPDPGSATNILNGGTKTITVTGMAGQMLSKITKYKASSSIDTVTSQDTYTYLDDLNKSYQVIHLDGTTNLVIYACCGLDSETDPDGVTTQYYYDAMKRQISTVRNAITISTTLDALGRTLMTIRNPGGGQIVQSQQAYDLAGRVVYETNALNGVTSHLYGFDGSGQLIKTNINPDLGTRIEIYAQDGSLVSVAGTAAYPLTNLFGVDGDGAYTTQVKLDGSGGANEWVKTSTDMAGRAYKTVYASASGSPAAISYYNILGQLTNQVDPDGVSMVYDYNGRGEMAYTVMDTNQNHTIDFSGPDRITWTTNDVISDNGTNVLRTQTYVWGTNSNTSNLLSTVEVSTDGLTT